MNSKTECEKERDESGTERAQEAGKVRQVPEKEKGEKREGIEGVVSCIPPLPRRQGSFDPLLGLSSYAHPYHALRYPPLCKSSVRTNFLCSRGALLFF